MLSLRDVPSFCVTLGSDVPFFALGDGLRATDGETKSYKLDDAADYWVLLVDPGVMISTVEAYSWLTLPGKSNNIEGFCGAV